MKNLNLLIEKNCLNQNKGALNIYNSIFYCVIEDEIFSEISIKRIIYYIDGIIKKFGYFRATLLIEVKSKRFKDKLSVMFLECLCYYLLVNLRYNVKVCFKIEHNIWTEGIRSSPLRILNSYEKKNADKYIQKFQSELYQNHFRRLIKFEDIKNTDILSKTMTNLDIFLSAFGISEEFRIKVAEVIVELIGNAGEHGHTDCLVDIDVADKYKKRNSDGIFCGVNVAVVNFSDKLVGEAIRKKILENDNQEGRYKELLDAYIFHRNHFNERYTQEDFFNIAAFQHKISGREKNTTTGGTGLTKLIKALEELSDTHICYMASGDRTIDFNGEYLKYDENRWIGFNSSGNFISDCPNPGVLTPFRLFLPGVAYNLNFALEKGE